MSLLFLELFVCCRYTHNFVFFFNDTATTEIYTLSLHDALPISCRTYEKYITFLQFNFCFTGTICPFIMIINCNREYPFCHFLTDNIIIQEMMNLLWYRKFRKGMAFHISMIGICNDFITEGNALITNINRGACNKFFYLIMPLTAE